MAGPSSTNESQDTSDALVQGLQETTQKVEASLLEAIGEHINSTDFAPSDGLDFLDTKNSLLLSYLIDLTFYLRERLSNKSSSPDDDESSDNNNRHRLTEMKTALDKLRGLDKKLRYQIDKLLAAGTTATTFVTSGEDPLQFRPNAAALETKDKNSSSDDDDNGEEGESDGNSSDGSGPDDEEDIDADLAAARMTLTMAKSKSSKNDEAEEDSGVYRAPRMSAVPYTHDQVDKQAEREKRENRRMRASELAQTLRNQYGEAPETEDMHGGSEVGKQRDAARRMATREAEKTKFEEDTMVRMTELRKDKKERKRLLRDETSNLAAIADLGNIVREADFGDSERRKVIRNKPTDWDGQSKASNRHANGKRIREVVDREGRTIQQGGRKNDSKSGGRKNDQAKNSFQAALFDTSEGKSKKKKGKR
jgi:U3 small nucleolar ribonucleoprotein protein LCP5